MSRPILSRPRTRVYGCNYDKGESYYKPMVDHLDRKYSGRPLFSEPRTSFADEIAARRSDIGTRDLAGSRNNSFGRDVDLDFEPRTRIQPLTDPFLADDEDTVYDSRGQRTRRKFADDFANEVVATTRRFKARVSALGLDDELEEGPRPVTETGDKFMEGFKSARTALEEADSAFKRRSKLIAEELERIEEKPSLTRWSKLAADDIPSAAANRAKQTKARLDDLECEMEELAEKQAKRERRAAALRALVNENATNVEDQFLQKSSISNKSVSVRASERSEATKHVTF